jgi:hypothetical protein
MRLPAALVVLALTACSSPSGPGQPASPSTADDIHDANTEEISNVTDMPEELDGMDAEVSPDAGDGDVAFESDGDTAASDAACLSPGEMQCVGNAVQVCDSTGVWQPPEDCGAGTCNPSFGCMICTPDSRFCQGDVARKCKPDGSGFKDEECDPLLGSACVDGGCTGPCAPEAVGRSYVGCDYFPTVTTNGMPLQTAHFAVAVSNTTPDEATVTVSKGDDILDVRQVAPNSVELVLLPWVDALFKPSTTALVPQGAYRVRSTRPVTVYQFNPLEYQVGSVYTYSNDASLLLPTTAWRLTYMVATRPHWTKKDFPAFYAVTANVDGTTVTLQPSPSGWDIRPGAGVAADGTGLVLLNRGDVLQVLSAGGDPTGTLVLADRPVQVIAGHHACNVPEDTPAADHLEDAMFPIDTLGKDYLVAAPAVPYSTAPQTHVVRIVAAEGPTVLQYDPPMDAPTVLDGVGAFFDVNAAQAFRVTADKRILVAQFMVGQEAGGGAGDPAMALAVPVGQYLAQYLFHAPVNYEQSYVNIVAPSGAQVTLDGVAVPVVAFQPIGGTGYSVARVKFTNTGNGTHRVQSESKVGISVYGYGQYTSYWYPGGLNLGDL